jgi:transposase
MEITIMVAETGSSKSVVSVPPGGHLCVGIDLHKDTMTICILVRGSGEVVYRKIACKNREQIAEFFRRLPRPHTVAIESVGFYRWLWELLEPLVEKLVLCDATQARALAGRRLKTDCEDAANVAELLAVERLPLAYAPPAEVQALRDWTRQRNRLSRDHARALHGVKSIMNANNRPGSARLDSAGLHRYLKAFGDLLPERHVKMLWQLQRRLSFLEEEIGISEREVVQRLESARFADAARLLYTAPGVGPVVAATVLAEIGDFHRFPDGKAIGRYAGLAPRLYNSGGKERHGHISKTGPSDLRWALQQAAWTAIRCDGRIKEQWLKMARGGKKKAAAVGIARKLLVILWHMATTNSEYHVADSSEEAAKEATGNSSAPARRKGPPLPPPPSPRPSLSEGEATAKAEGASVTTELR